MKDLIEMLQEWYSSECNGSWEHSYGINISTLDNPGWAVTINKALSKGGLQINIDRDEGDWIRVMATKSKFEGYGGPKNLRELLVLAFEWLGEKE
ncbi:immunity 53 family protein [Cupriavidus sp. SW-Y-13]|uniref:immunity 53 family protein n=1 Tax=Cupriavidus sp. SW-Y-13 TaxID=2653854 RepID=UPI0013657A4C|nr:immunity 53 family protein [Cupriavidus sp. SW-Y-13]MWL90372.1 hypothetical protein [Cupriavidus sp. SW-Y-13]